MTAEIVKDQKAAIVIGCEGFVGEYLLKMLSKHSAYKTIYAIVMLKNKVDLPKVKTFYANINQIEFDKIKANDLFICYDASFFNSGGKYAIPANKRTSSDALLHVSRTRGLIEEIVIKTGFWSTHVFKPSLLLGETINQKWGQSWADKIGDKIDSVTGGWLKKNKPIEAEVVARAMIFAAQKLESGVHFYSSEWLQDFASENLDKKDLKK